MKHKDVKNNKKLSREDPSNTNIHMKISEIQISNSFNDQTIKGQKNIKLYFSASSEDSDQFFNSKSESRDQDLLSKPFVFKEKFTF